MHLTHAQKKQLVEQGFLHVAGVVPPIMVEAARRAINASIGRGMNVADMTRFQAQSFTPELQDAPVIADLFNRTPARPLVESAIGAERLSPVKSGQIALRFPTMKDPPPPLSPHIDGIHTPTNGVPEGDLHSFTALVGIYLSDVPAAACGNLTVWPGTHWKMAEYFRTHDHREMKTPTPRIELPQPQAIIGSAGDMIIANYLTVHGVWPNSSPNVRYAVFFRVYSIDHAETQWEAIRDPWLQWHGLRDITAPAAESAPAGRAPVSVY
jgi:hypothetical protein